MKASQLILGVVALAWALSATPAQTQKVARMPSAAIATDRVIVKFRDDLARAQATKAETVTHDRIAGLATRTGMQLQLARSVTAQVHALRLARAMGGADLQATIARIGRDAAVEYAVPDQRKYRALMPNDPGYGTTPTTQQWYLTPPSSTFVAPIDAEHAWDITTGSSQVVVAVIDSGVLYDHPDLGRVAQGGKILPGYDMISDPVIANDGDGRDADASDPGDWVTQADLSNATFKGCAVSDSSWHGTHIAGIIGAATNNGVGIAGIGWRTLVLPVRALGKCFGYDSDIIAGMRWAAGLSVPDVPVNPNPARVLSMSLGSQDACTQPYADAVNELSRSGILVVAAAGNESAGASDAPANCAGVLSVTALRHVGTKVGFANWGTDVAIAAPGGNCVNTAQGSPCLYPIVSTSNDGTKQPGNMTYDGQLGTSFSTPMVAGVAGLMLAANPNISLADLRQRLLLTARAFPAADPSEPTPLLSCSDPKFTADTAGNLPNDGRCNCDKTSCGAGMLDAAGAVRSAINPVAVASGPSSAGAGQTITIDGSSSVASPGNAASIAYRWQVTGDGTTTLGATNGPTLNLSATAGSYNITLTVSDASGHSDSRTVALQVTANTSTGGGGGGGGAIDAAQLLALVALGLIGAFRSRRRD